MPADLDDRELYRLPWSFSDNAIASLEPTGKCDLAYEGCYRANVEQHKGVKPGWRGFDAAQVDRLRARC